MMMHTRSATPLERVMIEPSQGGRAHVWLRRNIEESVETSEGGQQPVWDADEVYFYADETPTLDEVEAAFGQLWARYELDGVSELDQVRARQDEIDAALMELADLIAGGE